MGWSPPRDPYRCPFCGTWCVVPSLAAEHCQPRQEEPTVKRPGHDHTGFCCRWGGIIYPALTEANRERVDRWIAGGVSTRVIAAKVNALKLGPHVSDQQVLLHRNGLCNCCRHEAALRGGDGGTTSLVGEQLDEQ